MQRARASIGLVLSRVRCLVILAAFAKYDCQRQNLGNKTIEEYSHWSTHLITKDLQKKICSLWLTKDNKLRRDGKGFGTSSFFSLPPHPNKSQKRKCGWAKAPKPIVSSSQPASGTQTLGAVVVPLLGEIDLESPPARGGGPVTQIHSAVAESQASVWSSAMETQTSL